MTNKSSNFKKKPPGDQPPQIKELFAAPLDNMRINMDFDER